jgi:perosamine synthetase
MIPLAIPHLSGNELEYVKECINTNWLCEGRFLKEFEEKVKDYTNIKNCIPCSNGTAALHISLIVTGVKSNEEVIVPTVTFIAPINTLRYIGAYPVFMDCDNHYNIDVKKLQDFLETECEIKNGFTYNKKSGRKISAIIPVHIFGNSADMDPINKLSKEYNIKIIEDASESIGTRYKDKHTGGLSDIGCFSFNANKIVTSAGGGMILTNNDDLAKQSRYLISQAKEDGVHYMHHNIGYNYRLSNVHAAIGLAQFENIDKSIQIKINNYNKYKEQLSNIKKIKLVDSPSYSKSNHWFYTLQLDSEKSKNEIIEKMNNNKIQVRPIWYLNHLQKPYVNFQNYKIENAIDLWKRSVNIPCSIDITDDQISQVVDIIKQYY